MSGITVLGAGAFGTALAIALAAGGRAVALWGRDAGAVEEMTTRRENTTRLPGHALPPSISVTADLSGSLGDGPILLALPMQQLAAFLEQHAAAFRGRTLVACCKGLDLASGRTPSSLIDGQITDATPAILTGPSFATDIAAGLPTALTLAARDDATAQRLQHALSSPTLRLYRSDDLVGAEMGGALKNVIALAAGITLGAGLGESARAAIVTRGFAEMSRLARAAGARPETLMGLAGLGDLVLTATSEKSRNFSAGLAIGRGAPLPDQTTEGIATAHAVARFCQDRGLEMPITETVSDILSDRIALSEAVDRLLARPLKKETAP